MALILLFDKRPTFKEKLVVALQGCQDFIIKTPFGRDDTLPALLLELLYRKIHVRHIDDYDLRSWTDEGGRVTIKATYEGASREPSS